MLQFDTRLDFPIGPVKDCSHEFFGVLRLIGKLKHVRLGE
jgi:hypothetical protein